MTFRFMRPLVIAGGLFTLTISGPAAAELRPAPLGQIFESYNDCFDVAVDGGLNEAALLSKGWGRGKIDGRDPKPGEPNIYGHGDRSPLILLSNNLCIVTARIENEAAFEKMKAAWGGKLPPPDKDGVYFFMAEGRIVRLQRMGSKSEPGVSLAVMSPTEKK